MCSDKAWYDTSLRLPQNLCCDPEKGKADPTFKSCDHFDDNGKLKAKTEQEWIDLMTTVIAHLIIYYLHVFLNENKMTHISD